jgi:hypothetical protein
MLLIKDSLNGVPLNSCNEYFELKSNSGVVLISKKYQNSGTYKWGVYAILKDSLSNSVVFDTAASQFVLR